MTEDLIKRMTRITRYEYTSRDVLIHGCYLGQITMGDVDDLVSEIERLRVRSAALIEMAAEVCADYPRAAPDESEWTRYDEQIEHSQACIRALATPDDHAALEAILGPLREEIDRLRISEDVSRASIDTLKRTYNQLFEACRGEQTRAEKAEAEVERLREGLASLASDAEAPQEFYDKNGPQWTSEQGGEYEDTSSFLDKCNELAATARAALTPPQGRMRDG